MTSEHTSLEKKIAIDKNVYSTMIRLAGFMFLAQNKIQQKCYCLYQQTNEQHNPKFPTHLGYLPSKGT